MVGDAALSACGHGSWIFGAITAGWANTAGIICALCVVAASAKPDNLCTRDAYFCGHGAVFCRAAEWATGTKLCDLHLLACCDRYNKYDL